MFVEQAMKETTAHCHTRPLPPPREPFMWLSGLEDLVVTKERFQFLNVGERLVSAPGAFRHTFS